MIARLTGALMVASTIALALPAGGAAQRISPAVQEVYDDYTSDGKIDPCKHSAKELREAEQRLPDQLEKLAPEFPAAVAAALEGRGDCDEKSAEATPSATATVTPSATPSPSPAPSIEQPAPVATATPPPPPPPAKAAAQDDDEVPIAAIALAALALAIALAALLVLLLSRGETGEERTARLRHTWGEAAYRAGGAWMDFKDWVRLGR